jgi:hypothetical protein
MGGRVVEGTGLENRQGRKSFVGSNPTPSAIAADSPPFEDRGFTQKGVDCRLHDRSATRAASDLRAVDRISCDNI